jgi:hypothetical protein
MVKVEQRMLMRMPPCLPDGAVRTQVHGRRHDRVGGGDVTHARAVLRGLTLRSTDGALGALLEARQHAFDDIAFPLRCPTP